MSFYSCPQCRREVSAQDEVCPHCGYSFKPSYWDEVWAIEESLQKRKAQEEEEEREYKRAIDSYIEHKGEMVSRRIEKAKMQRQEREEKSKGSSDDTVKGCIVVIVIIALIILLRNC